MGAVNQVHPGYVTWTLPAMWSQRWWDGTELIDRCPNSGSFRGMRGTLYDFFFKRKSQRAKGRAPATKTVVVLDATL